MVLKKLKSLLGFDDDESDAERQRDVGVTVEREPAEEPDTGSEDAVKGTDTSPGAGETAAGSGAAEPSEPTDAPSEPTDAASVEEPDEPVVEADDEPAAGESEPAEPADEAASEDELIEEAVEDETAEEAEEDETAEAAGEETAAEPSDGADGEDVTEIKGIGPAYGERLANVGIDSVAQLADADAEEIAAQTDLSEKRVSEWIERAKVR
ncbi:hypothetical protein G9464_08385 [Halostella sp. JP-L12]|uniref:helix-hairpin-helix domain-containing protein n=1 Tax=Halostella TaxID=1843185 RepID=UPI000EF7C74C|nr:MULTISPECIES: helix-hairpin-helix domain-containing protein [Halostella]NHN47612.1 hypothetical protein [Halostella sp. JP-L12]